MKKTKKNSRLSELKSIHSKSSMQVAQRVLRLARSNAKEGFCQHALNYLVQAAVDVGQAQGHEYEASGRSTSRGNRRDTRDTLYSVGKRVAACFKAKK